MLKNQSLAIYVLWTTVVCLAVFILLGACAIQANNTAQNVLKTFFSDFSRSINKLQAVEDIYEAVVRNSAQTLLMQTLEPKEAIDRIEEAISEADVRLKDYMNVERSVEEERHLLNQELENAINSVNLSWIVLKEALQGKEPDLAKGHTYILQEFYPRLDTLNRSYSRLLSRWMNQLDVKQAQFRAEIDWQRRCLWMVLLAGCALIVLAHLLLMRTIWASIDKSARDIDAIGDKKTDFTLHMPYVSNVETNLIATSVNQWIDELLLVMRRIKESSLSVWSFMPHLFNSSKELVGKIGDFSHFTTEVGETAKEISDTSKELVKWMTDVSQTTTDTAELATLSQTELVRLETTMQQMEEAARKISKRLAIISEKAANITMVVTTINKFADQTNLLSLNASIEAEKAGEYGLGFAVVAREIRRLADQVGLATYDIEQMVKEMKSAVTSGVMEMDKFSDEVSKDVRDVRTISTQFTQIIEQVQTLIPCFDAVHAAVQTQSQGAEHISDSMVHLNQAVEKTSLILADSSSRMHQAMVAADKLHLELEKCVVDKT